MEVWLLVGVWVFVGVANTIRSQVNRQLGWRPLVVAAAIAWAALTVAIVIAYSLDVTSTLLLAVTGMIAVGLLHAYRHHHMILQELNRIRERIDGMEREGKTVAATASETLDRVKLSALYLGRISADHAQSFDGLKRLISHEADQAPRNIEALQNLYSMIPVEARVPPMRQWNTSADVVLELVELLREVKPRLVVECGSGVTTLWLALAVEHMCTGTRVVCLDDDPMHALQTVALLTSHGVAHRSDVRHAPITVSCVDGEQKAWYAPETWSDVEDIGLVVVNEQSGGPDRDWRLPALLSLADRLADSVRIVITNQSPEAEDVDRWLGAVPALALERVVNGSAWVLRRRSADSALLPLDQHDAPHAPAVGPGGRDL